MRKPLLLILVLLITTPILANNETPPPLNKVTFQLSAEKWVITKTAKVTVSIDATLNATGLARAHQHIMGKLAELSNKAPWYITQFNRSQDKSGLERLRVLAEARLPEDALVKLRAKAKVISKPGQTFRIANVLFTPSAKAMEKARADLRATIYQKAQYELTRINHIYSKQHYYLHSVDFIGKTPIARGQNLAMMAYKTAGVAVSNKAKVFATVILASSSASYDKK